MPPFNYSDLYQKPSRPQQIGQGVGALISAALAASQGQSTGDAIARGAAGALSGYGSAMNQQEEQQRNMLLDAIRTQSQQEEQQRNMFGNALRLANLNQDVRQYEETNKPYMQALTDNLTQKSSPEQRDYNKKMAELKLSTTENQNLISRNKAQGEVGGSKANLDTAIGKQEGQLLKYQNDYGDVIDRMDDLRNGIGGELTGADANRAMIELAKTNQKPIPTVEDFLVYRNYKNTESRLNSLSKRRNPPQPGSVVSNLPFDLNMTSQPRKEKELDRAKALEFKALSNGNRAKAEDMARRAGYTWGEN